jgi:hypothetical protein
MSCEICSKIECKFFLFVLKLDNFSKHVGKRKAKVTTKGVQTSKFFYYKNTNMLKMRRSMLIWQRGLMFCVATPLWAKCEGEAHTPKSGNLESSETLGN